MIQISKQKVIHSVHTPNCIPSILSAKGLRDSGHTLSSKTNHLHRVAKREDSRSNQITPTGTNTHTKKFWCSFSDTAMRSLFGDHPQRERSTNLISAEKRTVRGLDKSNVWTEIDCGTLLKNPTHPQRIGLRQFTGKGPSFFGDFSLKVGPDIPKGTKNQILPCHSCKNILLQNNKSYTPALSSTRFQRSHPRILRIYWMENMSQPNNSSPIMDAIRSHCSSLCIFRGTTTISSAII